MALLRIRMVEALEGFKLRLTLTDGSMIGREVIVERPELGDPYTRLFVGGTEFGREQLTNETIEPNVLLRERICARILGRGQDQPTAVILRTRPVGAV
jgi:hypothetical protein